MDDFGKFPMFPFKSDWYQMGSYICHLFSRYNKPLTEINEQLSLAEVTVMSISDSYYQSTPRESRMKRLGRKLSIWWKRETTAADVSNAFQAATRAHEKYANNADTTFRVLRDWSNQLASPSFAPELGNPLLQEYMLEMCAAVRPDPTKTCQLNELLASIAQSFQWLVADELNCKKYVHELMAAKKSVDKCRSYSQDSGLLEKTCEYWEARLNESIQTFRSRSSRQLGRDVDLLLSYLKAVEPATHEAINQIDNAYQTFGKLGLIISPENGTPRVRTDMRSPPEDVDESSSPLYNLKYEPNAQSESAQTSIYSGHSTETQPSEANNWAITGFSGLSP